MKIDDQSLYINTSDSDCGKLMAISKVMSGALIYLSDNPSDFYEKVIRPLAYEDGQLLRPLSPGFPLSDSVMMDVYNSGKAFRVIAPLASSCAAIITYNPFHLGDGFWQFDLPVVAGSKEITLER